jgi:hypothetical protein
MKYLLVLFTLAGLVVSSGCTPDGADQADRSGEVRLCPVLRLKAEGPYKVPLTLSNGTDQPFIYVTTLGEVVGFDYSLRRNGKEVPSDSGTPGPGLNPVYTPHSLKAGERVSFSYKLNRHYKLEPGEYDLQVVYRIYEGSTINLKNDATPAHFTLNHTLIVE